MLFPCLALVLAGSAFILMLFLVIIIIWCLYKRNPISYCTSKNKSPIIEDQVFFFGVSVFSYKDLEDATRNFDPALELGNGGFGVVYYGENFTPGNKLIPKIYMLFLEVIQI